jgi:hypothetical protein
MKVKIEDLGTSYRIYELAYTEPLRWPTGEEFIVSYANAKYLFNQNQLHQLNNDSGTFLFNLSRSRISYAMKVFGGNPRMFAEEDIDGVIKEMQANEAAAVDGATLTPKFVDGVTDDVTTEATADAV